MKRDARGGASLRLAPIALLFFALTVLLTYPLGMHPASTLLMAGGDTHLTLWLLGWDVRAFTHHLTSIFDANILYPYRHTLAFAENVIGSAVLVAPVVWLTGNLVLALNVVTILSIMLCGLGTYVLARRLGVGVLGAVIGGIVFAFAPPRFFRIAQIHLTTVEWMPFCLAYLHGYLDTGRRADLWWASGFLGMQALTSGHGAVFTVLSAGVVIAWRVILGERWQLGKRLRDGIVPAVALIALMLLIFLPYRAVQQELGLRRTLSDAYLYAPTAASFLASSTRFHQFVLSAIGKPDLLSEANSVLFPGYGTLVLAAVGVALGLRRQPRQPKTPTPMQGSRWRWVAWTLDLFFVLSVVGAIIVTAQGGARIRYGGNVIISIRQPWRVWLDCLVIGAFRAALLSRVPLDIGGRCRRLTDRVRRFRETYRCDPVAVYLLLTLLTLWLALGPSFGLYKYTYNLPGLNFIRASSRYTIVTILGLSVLAAFGFDRLSARLSSRKQLVLALVVGGLLVGEFAAIPLEAVPYVPPVPPVDRWLDTQPKPFVVAEVPSASRWHSAYMLHSMAHWQKTIEGFSGILPELNERIFNELVTFPDEKSLKSLTDVGVTYVVVHANLYPPEEWADVKPRFEDFKDRLTLIHEDGDDRVYAIRR